MANTREFNRKLKTLKNTQKMTKTMKMVSASKLRRAHQAQANAKQYAQKITDMITRVAMSVEGTSHPLLTAHPKVNNILVLIFRPTAAFADPLTTG